MRYRSASSAGRQAELSVTIAIRGHRHSGTQGSALLGQYSRSLSPLKAACYTAGKNEGRAIGKPRRGC